MSSYPCPVSRISLVRLHALATLLLLMVMVASPSALAQPGEAPDSTCPVDEPGPSTDPDEPAYSDVLLLPPPTQTRQWPWFRIEAAFGYASLLDDPDVGEGYGGGLYLTVGLHRLLGAELSVFFTYNPYDEELGTLGTSFVSGNITLGPVLRLTPRTSRFDASLELGLGTYLIVPPPIMDSVWTFGIYGGGTFAVRLIRWLGVGLKLRYHLFNLATISGDDLRDLKALMKVGVIDRMDLSLFISFYF